MKKITIVFLLFIVSVNQCISQEWMTSLEIAKRLARVQNKMLFVMWEESTKYEFPVVFDDENGQAYYTDLFENENINKIIWAYFVPVKLNDLTYPDLFSKIENKRSDKYIRLFQNDGIKIMDANGNILNTGSFHMDPFNFVDFIERYQLNTSFLKAQLHNYFEKRTFYTTMALGSKYLDYAVFVNKKVRKEVTDLAFIYIDESYELLGVENIENKEAYRQRFILLELKKDLILNRPRKVLRYLKKVDVSSINPLNESLFAFAHYAAYQLIEDEKKAAVWKSKVSLVDLKKAELILNINN
ncbi:MAG: hypothetical protein KJO77_02265 [Bacteroidia bacterium]|nr:hypothetical protein [Bacteroidia bacterium]NND52606.1 hypothetical protein [Flavobacteriaceae bacterium]